MTFVEVAQMTEEQAREYLEGIRWPDGAFCPHCGDTDVLKLAGKSHRPGLHQCNGCRKQFTVTVGTVMERSHIKLRHWVFAFHSMCASKKGISAHQLHRSLGITYKSAWFMCHRIRHAMKEEPMARLLKGTVESDETWVGGRVRGKKQGYTGNKTPVVTLVERESGKARSSDVSRINGKNLRKVLADNVDPNSQILTDENKGYNRAAENFLSHDTVNHSRRDYARGDIHVSGAESYFALLKRGIHGVFHHLSRQHLPRYCAEFDFRWNLRKSTDSERAHSAIRGIAGKRLIYNACR